jgi:hypothetical protein
MTTHDPSKEMPDSAGSPKAPPSAGPSSGREAKSAPRGLHKPSPKHTLEEVLKSLQDLIRNELLEAGSGAAPPQAPPDASGRSDAAPLGIAAAHPRMTVREDFAPAAPDAEPVNLSAVMRSLKDLLHNELDTGEPAAAPSPTEPALSAPPPQPRDPPPPISATVVHTSQASPPDETGPSAGPQSLDEIAQEWIAAAAPATAPPALASPTAASPAPGIQQELPLEAPPPLVVEARLPAGASPPLLSLPSETEPAVALPRRHVEEEQLVAITAAKSPATSAATPTPDAYNTTPGTEAASPPPAAVPGAPQANTHLKLALEAHAGEGPGSLIGEATAPETTPTAALAPAAGSGSEPDAAVTPAGTPQAAPEDTAAATTPEPPVAAASLAADPAPFSLDDIPVLKDVVAPPAGSTLIAEPPAVPAPPPPPAPDGIRDLVVRAVAKLNIEMRRSGGTGLDTKTILRLQQLICQELEKNREE